MKISSRICNCCFALGLLIRTSTASPHAIVVPWGDGAYHESDMPPGAPQAVSIAAGGYHSLVLKTDGTVLGWGADFSGQIEVPGGLTNVTAIQAGQGFSLALRSDGTVIGWGRNAEGQINVPDSGTNVASLSAGQMHSLVLKQDGTVVGWGDNSLNQLNIPPGENHDLVAIDSGAIHNLALRNNGTVLAWGWSQYGQTNVPAGLSGVAAVAAGSFHSLALKTNGTVVAWGDNTSGQCNVPAALSGVVAIAGGNYHSLALKSNGTVVGWGGNGQGQISVPTWLTGVVAIAAGDYHSIALTRAPVIVGQPVNATVVAGSNASFTVQALAGSPLIYQWQLQGTNLLGATSETLSIPNALVGDVGSYRVVVSNSFGSVMSSAAGLTVNYPPTITNQPISQTVLAGRDVAFSVSVGGTAPFACQWRFQGSPISGAAGTVLVLTNVQASLAGDYDVMVSNVASSVVSSNATLIVSPAPPDILLQPVSVIARAGTDVVFVVVVRGSTPFAYQWLTDGQPISGANDATLSLQNVQALKAADYSVLITNAFGSITSQVATLAVLPSGPVMLRQPATQMVLIGTNCTFDVLARGTDPIAYQWQYQGTDISGQTGSQLALANVQPSQAGAYTVSITNSEGFATSTPAYLLMPPLRFNVFATNLAGFQPDAITVGDFNHDARPDIATADRYGNTVTILLGKGNGNFAPSLQFPVGSSPIALDVADFNRDGHPDIVTANAGGTFSILRGTTNGTFTAVTTVSLGFSPFSVRAGDFNGDGKPDLVFANYSGSYVVVFQGNGNGTFVAANSFPVAQNPISIAVADLNADGNLDVVTANDFGNSVSVLLGVGNGTFAPSQSYALGTVSGRPQTVALGDFNRDGKLDIATANGGNESVSLLLGQGGGNFSAGVPYGGGSRCLVVDDFNGDGQLDVAVTDELTGNLKVFLGLGNGALAPWVAYSAGRASRSLAVGDFNLDGKPDLVLGDAATSSVVILLNEASVPRPTLLFGLADGQAELSWPVFGAGGFKLETTTSLTIAGPWLSITNQPSTTAGILKIRLPLSGDRTFFRLRKP